MSLNIRIFIIYSTLIKVYLLDEFSFTETGLKIHTSTLLSSTKQFGKTTHKNNYHTLTTIRFFKMRKIILTLYRVSNIVINLYHYEHVNSIYIYIYTYLYHRKYVELSDMKKRNSIINFRNNRRVS